MPVPGATGPGRKQARAHELANQSRSVGQSRRASMPNAIEPKRGKAKQEPGPVNRLPATEDGTKNSCCLFEGPQGLVRTHLVPTIN
jgi:hypothetical protein